MRPEIPDALIRQASSWDELSRADRAALGRSLRSVGLMQSEIREIIPVPKSTLSNWCREVELTAEQTEAIRQRGYSHTDQERNTQAKRRAEIRELRRSSQDMALDLCRDPMFTAGLALYWAEGAKSRSDLTVANTDPALLRLFIAWVRTYLDGDAEFRLSLHLHGGNDEVAAKRFWRRSLSLPAARFTKTYIKPPGTGHRKNHLEHGVCRVRVCRSADMWHATMAWIDHMRDHGFSGVATLAPGR